VIGPLVPGASGGPHCARVPGTSLALDPCAAAFSTGALVSWLGYNDAWLAAEWCASRFRARRRSRALTRLRPLRIPRVHPSDTLGALLSVADHVSALRRSRGAPPLLVRELLTYLVKAYEITGLLACDNALNTIGVDGGPLFAKVAAAACCAAMLGGGRREVAAAASQAFGDGAGLRCFRHAPSGGGGGRAAWAAGDAASRAVWHALHALRGEPGLSLVLSSPVWGFQDVFFRRAPLVLPRPLGEHVAPRVLFRAVLPAETHAAACAEAALPLHPLVCHRVEEVAAVVVHAPRAAVRAADRTGPLGSPAERAHCIQYCVAAALLYGTVTGEHFGDSVAADPRLAELRARTAVAEHPPFSAAYADAASRATPAAVQVHFADRSATPQAALTYTLGHAARRAEGLPALRAKLLAALRSRYTPARAGALAERFADAAALDATPVPDLLDLLADPPVAHALSHAPPPPPRAALPPPEPPLLAAGVARIALAAPPPPDGGEVPMQGGGSPREAWRTTDGSTTARTWRPEPH
jgi:2-methylcitrate dehydratase